MIAQPTHISLVAGSGEGADESLARERAWEGAGLPGVGLLPLQSALLENIRTAPLEPIHHGQLMPAVFACYFNDTPGERIAAAVALALSDRGQGVVRAVAGPGTAAEKTAEAERRAKAALEAHGLPLAELQSAQTEHVVEEQGCVVAAAVLWTDTRESEQDDWAMEAWTPHVHCRFRVRERLFTARSPYQRIDIVDTVEFGRMLLLDHTVQTTERDEWAYHEMLAWVPLMAHPRPKRVLIVGGGDGGLLRAALAHPDVEEAVQVEIDRLVVEACRAHMPRLSQGAFDDPRARVVYEDAFTFLERVEEPFDVALLDTTDPIGPAERLFTAEFYGRVADALGEEGVAAAQSGSPWFQPEVVARSVRAMRSAFPRVRVYLGSVPAYPGGLWTFTLGTRGRDPLSVPDPELQDRFRALTKGQEARFFSPGVYRAAFALPPFIEALLNDL